MPHDNAGDPLRVNVLCVPGPSSDPVRSGFMYFQETLRRLVLASEGLRLEVFVASFPEHQVPTVFQTIKQVPTVHTVVDRASLGLFSDQMSSEHGTLLNFLVSQSQQIRSDFTVVLDSDFFVLRGFQLKDVLLSMIENGVEIVGVPFPPEKIHQPWTFPAPYFQIWKSESLYSRPADFRPRWAVGRASPRRLGVTRSGIDQRMLAALKPLFSEIASTVGLRSPRRSRPRDFIGDAMPWKLGSQTYNSDTGCLVYEVFGPRLTTQVMSVVVGEDQEGGHLQEFSEAEYLRVNPDVPAPAAT